ncbi:MAG: zinc ribbon domain-containing protein [Deltaproteobacteria bacterium]|nr:zinc ribbon domain-containing protein [Deltaproteobacteria bacterium]
MMCPSCGLYQARLKRIDDYLSIFFLPVFRVKKGVVFLECQSCGSISHELGEAWSGPGEGSFRACPHCGKTLEPIFRFCPFCGKSV